MDIDARDLVIWLLSEYKHSWVRYRTALFLQKNPDRDPEETHAEYLDSVLGIFEPVNAALLEERPVREHIETALRILREFEKNPQ